VILEIKSFSSDLCHSVQLVLLRILLPFGSLIGSSLVVLLSAVTIESSASVENTEVLVGFLAKAGSSEINNPLYFEHPSTSKHSFTGVDCGTAVVFVDKRSVRLGTTEGKIGLSRN
jgi:hypothetical protein